MSIPYNDSTPMPFGVHRDKKLIDVPADYLIYLRNQPTWNRTSPLGLYIEANLQVLQQEAKKSKDFDNFLRK